MRRENSDDDCRYWSLTPEQVTHHKIRLAGYYRDLAFAQLDRTIRYASVGDKAGWWIMGVLLLLAVGGLCL